MSSIPFGPDHKDPPWRWGSFLIGVAGFIVLAAIMTLGGVWLLGWWRLILLAGLGLLLSARSGRAWATGHPPQTSFSRKVEPTIDVRGQAGSTYLLLEPARGKGRVVRPRDFSPGWWALYSAVVRAPVALGDFLLTIVWRLAAGRWEASGRQRSSDLPIEFGEHLDRFPPENRSF